MKKYLIIIILTVAPIILLGQQDEKPDYQLTEPAFNSSSAATGFNTSIAPLNFNLVTGMRFGTLGSGGYMESFLSPSLIMPLNKQLSISAGISYSNTQYNNVSMLNPSGEFERYSGSLNTITMYASGLYRINEKLTFTGSAYKTVNPALNSRLNPSALRMEAQGFSVGVGYQLNDKTFIGAEIRYQESNSNILNPFGDPYYDSFRGLGRSSFNNNYITPFGL